MPRPLALAILAMATIAAVAARPAQDVFRGTTDTVRVFVTVTDRDGRLVTTLDRGQFEVRDKGKPQPIVVFDNSPQPVQLVVMLDVSGSMSGNLPLLRAAAEQLFASLGPDDVARVGTFGQDITISPTFTREPASLQGALPAAISENAPTPLWRALDRAMDAFDATSDRRRVILVLSDGKDSGPIGFRGPFVSQADIIDRARTDNVMIYGIGLRSRSTMPPQIGIGPGALQAAMLADLPDPGLARTALDTGGGYAEIRPRQDLGTAFAQVADELHSQYLIGFAPPARDGKRHSISVRVSVKGLKPRARKDYVAPPA